MNFCKAFCLSLLLAIASCALLGQTIYPPNNSQATIRLLPANRTQVVNGYQSLTAQVSNSALNDVTFAVVSGPGVLVGSGNTVGVTASQPGDVTVIAVANANGASAEAVIHFVPAPVPNTGHPRILFTSADLPRLRALYVSSNPIYQNGFRVALQNAVTNTNAHWAWSYHGGNGQPDAIWQAKDTGGPAFQTASQYYTEEYMAVFAVASQLEANPATRAQYASMARDMLLWLMNQANGTLVSGVPFRGPAFPVGDRMRVHGWAYPTTVDCIYSSLTPSDFALIGQVFHRWAKAQSTSGVTSFQFPQPVGATDNISILTSRAAPLRWALNNHSIGAGSALLLESLALDENDDPSIGFCAGGRDTLCTDGNANSMHAYIKAYTGAWLLRQYAEYEDKGVVSAAYSRWLHTPVPANTVGESAGGYSLEGTEYESSIGEVHLDLMALHNAGLDDPSIYGPQVSLRTSTYFDLFLQSTMAKISPTPELEHTGYWGNINAYEFMNFADDLRFYLIAETHAPLFNLIAADDNAAGDRSRSAYMQWFPDHAVCCSDTTTTLYKNAGGNAWANSDGLQTISYLLAADPANPPADPRSTLPLDYTAPWGRYLGRTAWTSRQSSWVGYKCSFMTIDHQAGDCGLFEWNRNGEWLVKEQVAYDLNHYTAEKPDHHNVMGIQNTPMPVTGKPYLDVANRTGGQYWNQNNGDPTTLISYGPGYMSAFSDSTNLYNHPSRWVAAQNAEAVTHASRSMLWLKPDLLIYYDRADTTTAGLFKREHLQSAGAMSNSGNITTSTMPSGQTLYIQTLLPAANLAFTVAPADAVGSDGDPTKSQLIIDAVNQPASIRYLNVLQAADVGTSMLRAVAFQSTGSNSPIGVVGPTSTTIKPSASNTKPGPNLLPPPAGGNTGLDGVVVGNIAALFVQTPGPFAGATYKVPASTTQQYLTGLAPNTAYSVCSTRIPTPNGDMLSMKIALTPTSGCTTTPSDSSGTLAFQSE